MHEQISNGRRQKTGRKQAENRQKNRQAGKQAGRPAAQSPPAAARTSSSAALGAAGRAWSPQPLAATQGRSTLPRPALKLLLLPPAAVKGTALLQSRGVAAGGAGGEGSRCVRAAHLGAPAGRQ